MGRIHRFLGHFQGGRAGSYTLWTRDSGVYIPALELFWRVSNTGLPYRWMGIILLGLTTAGGSNPNPGGGNEGGRDGGGGGIHHAEAEYGCRIHFDTADSGPMWGCGETSGNTILKVVVGSGRTKLGGRKDSDSEVRGNRGGGGGGI